MQKINGKGNNLGNMSECPKTAPTTRSIREILNAMQTVFFEGVLTFLITYSDIQKPMTESMRYPNDSAQILITST